MNRSGWTETHAASYADAVLRIGLGVTSLLAGIHQFFNPLAWGKYVAPWFVSVWPLPLAHTMQAVGITEIVVGVALMLDRYTVPAALLAAIALTGVVTNLVTINAVWPGRYADVLIRDVGLLVLALGVVLRTIARREKRQH